MTQRTAEQERADVVAWLLREMYEPFVTLEMAKAFKRASDAIQRGDHIKGGE